MTLEQLGRVRELLEEVVQSDAMRGYRCHIKPCGRCPSCKAAALLEELGREG